jgi:hypothetical protein
MVTRTVRYASQTAVLWLLAASTCSAAQVKTKFRDICREAGVHQLTVVTSTGERIHGFCVSSRADTLQLSSSDPTKPVVSIARAAIAKLQVIPSGDNLNRLGKTSGRSMRFGLRALFSPFAPVGAVVVPVVAAYTAFSAPFCAIGDLHDRLHPVKELNII